MNIFQNKIGIGTVQFGINYGISNEVGKTPKEEVFKILTFAKNESIKYIDTAYAYGDAEEVIGQMNLESFRIISKYVPSEDKDLTYQFNESLHRLNSSRIYGYLSHRPLNLLENNKLNWNKLVKLRDQGLIRKIGASFNKVEEVETLLEANINPDIIQVPYNYFDRRFENTMKILRDRGCEIHTRSAFLQGLFFCEAEKLDSFFEGVKPILITIQNEPDLAAKLLKFVLDKEFIDVVNIGVNNVAQLKSNIENLGKVESSLPELKLIVPESILMPAGWPK